jgi:hypothetical protein
VWDHWKTKRPHHWEHTCEQISETHHHWGVWVAAVGRKQPLQRELYERRWRLRRRRLVLSNTLWELLYSGVCGCGIIGDMHGEQKSEQSNHLEVGVAMVGVKQHTFETTALGCVWGGGHEWWRATPMYYYCPRFRACQATRRVVWGRHDSWCATPMCCYCYHWVLLGPSRVSARPIKTKTSSCRESGIKEELLHTGIVLVAAHKLATS